mmetsp:Transcript_24855/g.36768  ORF Transcript_24855/g.36768 Transcript_24855/m.36768 type:complete len:99 (+) Transcript_24855:870-1166(+)
MTVFLSALEKSGKKEAGSPSGALKVLSLQNNRYSIVIRIRLNLRMVANGFCKEAITQANKIGLTKHDTIQKAKKISIYGKLRRFPKIFMMHTSRTAKF